MLRVASGLSLNRRPPARRFNPSEPKVTLAAWQERVLSLLNEELVRRRIIWVVGPPGSGKTTFSTWLESPYTLCGGEERGVLSMGACDSITNCLHRWSIQAVTMFDCPLSFDWRRKAESVATLVEKFSEYGTQRESTKYQGGTVRTRCHCLVFANVHPIDEVAHRDVLIVEAPPLVSDSQASTVPMGPRFSLVSGSTILHSPRGTAAGVARFVFPSLSSQFRSWRPCFQ